MAFAMKTHDTEVPAKARRRRFTAEYKQRILREVERCGKPGEIGALLRREGLYCSHLTAWRAARSTGAGWPRVEATGDEASRARWTGPARGGAPARGHALEGARGTGRAARRPPKKSLPTPRDRSRREGGAALMQAVLEVAPQVGITAACQAIGVPRASFYRGRRPRSVPKLGRALRSPPNLSEVARQASLDIRSAP